MNGFDDAMVLLKLATDPAAVKVHLAEVKAREDAAAAREQAAVQAEASLAAGKAEQEASQAKREQEVRAFHEAVLTKDSDADQKLDLARALYRRTCDMEAQMVRALMSHADVLSGFNERLQTLPDLKSVLGLLGAPKDAHYDNDTARATAEESETVVPDNRVSGSTLMRSVPRSRTAERREALSKQ